MYSMMHCRNRIREGTAMMIGRRYGPPQPRSGRPVALPLCRRNMHSEMTRSAMTLAYEVNTSASRMSPNFPSCECAMPPTLTRFRVERKRRRPL